MARISVDDCLTSIPSRFDLTMIASKRARQLARGAEAKLPWDGHKSTVLALKEIASGQVTAAVLKEMDLPVVKPPVPTLDALDTYFDNVS